MNRTEARSIVSTLLAAWPTSDMPPETMGLWVRMLEQFDARAGEAAAQSVVESEKYFPTIARFREALASSVRDHKREWVADGGCPLCAGATLMTDDKGRDWLCRCAQHERRPKVVNAVNAPPPALLAAARAALRTMEEF